jgi:hypothetical protein
MSAHDFDFWFGNWTAKHRRLKARLADCSEWEEFGGHCTALSLLGGAGNLDDNVIELPAGSYRAVTLRAFDPASDSWAIWWLDGRYSHDIQAPMIGRFKDGTGTFYADEVFEGRPIRVRFLWSHITPASCRWQQAFSPDAGKSWETNWIMDFTRVS